MPDARPATAPAARLPWHRRTIAARLACLVAIPCLALLVHMATNGFPASAPRDAVLLGIALAWGAATHRLGVGSGSLRVDLLDAALIALLVLLLLPAGISAVAGVAGLLLALAVARWALGGLGVAPLHPAMLAIAILLTAFPTAFVSSVASPVAEASLIVLAGLFVAIAIRLAHWRAPVSMAATAMLGIAAVQWVPPATGAWTGWLNVLPLAAFASITDSGSTCIAPRAQWLFGTGIGLLTVLLIVRGAPPAAIAYAVLAMNLLAPLLDRRFLPTFAPSPR